jgi:hypothetical protein
MLGTSNKITMVAWCNLEKSISEYLPFVFDSTAKGSLSFCTLEIETLLFYNP